MKLQFSLFACLVILLSACTKDHIFPTSDTTPSPIPSISGNGSSGGEGGTQPTGLISFVGGAYRVIGGNNDSIQVNFTQPAPATGWTVTLTTSDPSVKLPPTFFVSAGSYIIQIPLSSSTITSAKNVTITVKLNTETRNYVLKVFPLHFVFPTPNLQSPGNGAGFKNRIQVKFQWSDNANAYYHDIQISDNAAFNNRPVLEVYLNNPIWAASYFNGLGKRYWRVRYIDGSGAFGPWSSTNMFEIK